MELLAVVLHCPVCGNKYSADQTNIIDSRQTESFETTTVLVHADCERCKSSVVFSIAMDGPEIFSVGMVTDLSSKDAQKFRDAESISADEVIEFHDFLETFDGDFQRVLRIT